MLYAHPWIAQKSVYHTLKKRLHHRNTMSESSPHGYAICHGSLHIYSLHMSCSLILYSTMWDIPPGSWKASGSWRNIPRLSLQLIMHVWNIYIYIYIYHITSPHQQNRNISDLMSIYHITSPHQRKHISDLISISYTEVLGHLAPDVADGHGVHGLQLPPHAARRQRRRSDALWGPAWLGEMRPWGASRGVRGGKWWKMVN